LLARKKEIAEEKATKLAKTWKIKINKYKKERVERAKLSFLFFSLQIFKGFVKDKTSKEVPRYMKKVQKPDKEEQEYENKFKSKELSNILGI